MPSVRDLINAKDQLTNGEFIEGVRLSSMLKWMRRNRLPVPTNSVERNNVVVRWLEHRRRENRKEVKKVRDVRYGKVPGDKGFPYAPEERRKEFGDAK